MELNDQIAIVTGAGLGMGRAIAEKLSSLGAAVLVTDKDEEGAAQTAAAIEAAGGKAAAVRADVTRVEDITAMFDACRDKLGDPDILIANAGVSRPCPITQVTEEFFDQIYGVNAKGALFCLKEAGLRLKEGGGSWSSPPAAPASPRRAWRCTAPPRRRCS